jgi:putative ABC transport system permease protein
MRIPTRWRKVLGDLEQAPVRAALAVFAMATGVFGVAAMLTSYAVLERELTSTYSATRPSSATLLVDDVGDAVVDAVQRAPGVREAEARPIIRARIRIGQDEWRPLVLFVVRDFNDLRLDTFAPDAGAWPPADDELLIERSSLSVAQAALGDDLVVRVGDGLERTLRLAGSVHAAGLAPGWMEHVVWGFVSWSSIVRADASAGPAGLRVLVSENVLDRDHIRQVASQLQHMLELQGRTVTRIDVPVPGRHPHADQMATFVFLLGAFGALTLVLSAVLVANMVHALLVEQVRQVGVMKAVGASTRQVVALYLGHVALLAAAALAFGIPFGLWAGRGYARFAATILNATIADDGVPLWTLALQVALGLFVPLAVAVGPVYAASRLSIHEAFTAGVGRRPFGARPFDRWLARRRGLPRPLMLSLRTTFHRRGRVLLTIGTLAVGGAVFISALSVGAAWTRALDDEARTRRYDLDVSLSVPQPTERLEHILAALPALERAEYWVAASATLANPDAEAPDLHAHAPGGDRISLVAPDLHGSLLALPLVQGRWLLPEDTLGVVVNQALLARQPALALGGTLHLRVGARSVAWPVVGIVKQLAPFPTAYVAARTLRETVGQPEGTSRSLRLVARRHDNASVAAASRQVERALAEAGIGVAGVQSLPDARKAFEDHLVIIESALILAAALVVLVGALGLASTLTLNVIERTREFGILGAIGATPRTLAGHVVLEGVLLGTLSWLLAVLVAIPISLALDGVTGRLFVGSALALVMSWSAIFLWLSFVVVLAALSSLFPARRVGRLTVREALAHE